MPNDDIIDLARSAPFQLGRLTVEPPLCRVSSGETLEPRVMQVLVALARADGRVVSRDELIRTCWDGRIVGEDSITRVIGRLRRLAEARGEDAFFIETVPKVGYRLVGDIREADIEDRSSVAPAPLASPNSSRQQRRGYAAWAIASAVALAIVLLGFALARLERSHDRRALTSIQFTGFRALGSSASAQATILDETTRSAFTEDTQLGIVSATTPPRRGYVLSGTVDGSDASARTTARIDDADSRATLWARVFDPPGSGRGGGPMWVAAQVTNTARCGLSQAADHGARLPDPVMSLVFAECDAESESGARLRALELARRITKLQPDFASGWASRGFVAMWAAFRDPGPQASAWKGEARFASDRALQLDPTNSRALRVRADLSPPGDLAKVDRGLEAATRGRVSYCGCAFEEYGEFLVGLGRAAQAKRMFERAHADAPLAPQPVFALARMAASEGKVSEAYVLLDRLEALSPRPGAKAASVVSSSPWTKDYAGALKSLSAIPPLGPDIIEGAVKNALLALQAGDGAARIKAAKALTSAFETCGCGDSFQIRLVAALGDDRDALALLSLFNETQPHQAASTIAWDPALARARRLPEFQGLAERAGLVRYWRTTGRKPDFCATSDKPPVCAL